MEWSVVAIATMGAIIVTVLLGIPVAVSLGAVSIAFIWLALGPAGALSTVATEVLGFWSDYNMLALPLFIIMGDYLVVSGAAGDLFEFSSKWLRRVPGGLAMVSIGAGALFGTISGSSLAGIATIGTMAGPEMQKRGYSKSLLAGSIAAAGSLAQLIPPSIMMVIYAGLCEVSVGRQLIAGFVPGFLLAAVYGLAIIIWVRIRPEAAPLEPPVSWKERLAVARKLVLPALVVLLVLGSIYTGIATATEAAGMGALIAIIVAITYGRRDAKTVLEVALEAARTTAFIMFIAAAGKLLSWCLTYYMVPQNMIALLTALNYNRYVVMILVQITLLVMGMFINPVPIVIMVAPVMVPVLQALDFDIIWFGVVLMINLEVALITPPVAYALYIIKGMMPDYLSMSDVLKGGLIFALCDIAFIGLMLAFPVIALWLPNLMLPAQ